MSNSNFKKTTILKSSSIKKTSDKITSATTKKIQCGLKTKKCNLIKSQTAIQKLF